MRTLMRPAEGGGDDARPLILWRMSAGYAVVASMAAEHPDRAAAKP